MEYVCNAFSLQMVAPENWSRISIKAIEAPSESRLKAATSAVGHADTASVLGVAFNRASVTLNASNTLLVAQLIGGRLPEGCTQLPDGFKILWAEVTLL